MSRRELLAAVEALAERYRLRFARKTKAYVGLHAGVVLAVREWDGLITLQFRGPIDLSPPPPPETEVPERYVPGKLPEPDAEAAIAPSDQPFARFAYCDEAGLPLEWLSTVDCGCMLEIEDHRLAELGTELLLDVPDLIAQDFHAHGAPTTVDCRTCGSPATSVLLVQYELTPCCDACAAELLSGSPGGRLTQTAPVQWGSLCLLLGLATVAGGWLWGAMQQQQHVPSIALLLPVAWALGLCMAIARITPINLAARFLAGGSILTSIFLGNVWGFRTAAIRHMQQLGERFDPPSWIDSVGLYLQAAPVLWREEGPFYFGGALGVLLSWALLKRSGSVSVQ